jgi:hypothetical protein
MSGEARGRGAWRVWVVRQRLERQSQGGRGEQRAPSRTHYGPEAVLTVHQGPRLGRSTAAPAVAIAPHFLEPDLDRLSFPQI